MHIISCHNCGVVLDISRTPHEIEYDDDGSIDESTAVWDDGWWPAIHCPVCKTKIAVRKED